jgi:thiamine biosynthesis lipoprotein
MAVMQNTTPMTYEFRAFNTVNTVVAYTDDLTIPKKIDSLTKRYELLFSRTYPQSHLARINNALGKAVVVDLELAQFITLALEYCKESNGLFDITIGSVLRLWDFKGGVVPDEQSIADALKEVDYQTVDVQGASVRLNNPKARIDLGGIAKGYIADKIIEMLSDHQVESGLVNLGGNVKVLGEKPDGNAWNVGIRLPESSLYQAGDKALASLFVRDSSVVTSGIYERAFIDQGRLYHHILDPKTGYPAQTDLLGATIVSEKSLDGDGYSTTLIILGLEKALQFIEDRPGLEAVFVTTDGEVLASSAIGGEIPFVML